MLSTLVKHINLQTYYMCDIMTCMLYTWL